MKTQCPPMEQFRPGELETLLDPDWMGSVGTRMAVDDFTLASAYLAQHEYHWATNPTTYMHHMNQYNQRCLSIYGLDTMTRVLALTRRLGY